MAHEVMEAEQSHNLWSVAGDPGKLVVYVIQSKSEGLRTRGPLV